MARERETYCHRETYNRIHRLGEFSRDRIESLMRLQFYIQFNKTIQKKDRTLHTQIHRVKMERLCREKDRERENGAAFRKDESMAVAVRFADDNFPRSLGRRNACIFLGRPSRHSPLLPPFVRAHVRASCMCVR